tara:strand:- start:313 stop:600 length:288 start_codon:yes stop_codon:yes gene_type:complete
MIDTDKYEGHTEGTWSWERGALRVLHVKDSEPLHTLLHDEKKDIDAQLIADAPLLLEEVKRLQIECNALGGMIQWYMETGEMLDRDDWDAEGVNE